MLKNSFRLTSWVIVLLIGSSAIGEQQPSLPVGTKILVRPELTGSAQEQIAHCSKRIRSLRAIPDERERLNAMLQIMSSLALIPEKWPEANDAVLKSYLMRSDLALQWSMPKNAAQVLALGLPKSEKTPYHVQFEQKLGRAYLEMGDLVAAEAHLLAAERSPMFRKAHRAVAAGVLQQLATVYSRMGRPHDSVRRWRSVANLPGQGASAKAGYLLAALKEVTHLSGQDQRGEAQAIIRELNEAIATARSSKKPDLHAIAAYESDLIRLKKLLRL